MAKCFFTFIVSHQPITGAPPELGSTSEHNSYECQEWTPHLAPQCHQSPKIGMQMITYLMVHELNTHSAYLCPEQQHSDTHGVLLRRY